MANGYKIDRRGLLRSPAPCTQHVKGSLKKHNNNNNNNNNNQKKEDIFKLKQVKKKWMQKLGLTEH